MSKGFGMEQVITQLAVKILFDDYSVFYDMMRTIIGDWLMQSKKDGKDQESIQSSSTPDPGYR